MNKIFLFDLESVPTRYTCEWKEHFPETLRQTGAEVIVIEGPTDIPEATTPGAFLNFGGTNVYKARQVETFSRMVCDGQVGVGDYCLFADAWHPGVLQVKYMSELLGLKLKLGGLWHAGSYDPQDFLGRLIGDAAWVRDTERAMFNAFDHNFFATRFHYDLFMRELFGQPEGANSHAGLWMINEGKAVLSGWPMEYLRDQFARIQEGLNDGVIKKRNLCLFPHRLAPEKQIQVFKDLAKHFPGWDFVACQEQNLTKAEYHKLLGEARIVFSANLQETLGISMYEGLLCRAIPFVPDRLSYTEMYPEYLKYESALTEIEGAPLDPKLITAFGEVAALSQSIYTHIENPFFTDAAERVGKYFEPAGILATIGTSLNT